MDTSAVIRLLCQQEGISVTSLESEMGYGNGALTKGHALKSDRLLELSKRFGVSMEYLMGETDSVYFAATSFEYALILAYRKADELDQAMVDRVLKLEEKKKEATLPSLKEA